MEEKQDENGGLVMGFMLLMMMTIIALLILNGFYGWTCHISAIGEDKYCQDVSNDTYSHQWVVRSHGEDKINAEKAEEERNRFNNELANKDSCYDNGYYYLETFDIFEDYNLTCKKIDYLNNHLIDNFEKVDGGYVKGSYSGFLSSGYVEGKSYEYINQRIAATGKLIESIQYHVDCENSTTKWFKEHHHYYGWRLSGKDTTKIDYFTEDEFVMAYVDRCLD